MFQPLLCEKGLRPGILTWILGYQKTKTHKKYLGVKLFSKPPLFSLYIWQSMILNFYGVVASQKEAFKIQLQGGKLLACLRCIRNVHNAFGAYEGGTWWDNPPRKKKKTHTLPATNMAPEIGY